MKVAWLKGNKLITVREFDITDIAEAFHPPSMTAVQVPDGIEARHGWAYENGIFTNATTSPSD